MKFRSIMHLQNHIECNKVKNKGKTEISKWTHEVKKAA